MKHSRKLLLILLLALFVFLNSVTCEAQAPAQAAEAQAAEALAAQEDTKSLRRKSGNLRRGTAELVRQFDLEHHLQ